jgi:hypothetical protein
MSGHGRPGLVGGDALTVWPHRADQVDEQGQRDTCLEQPHRVVPDEVEQGCLGHVPMVRMAQRGS